MINRRRHKHEREPRLKITCFTTYFFTKTVWSITMSRRNRSDRHTILFLQPTNDESRTYSDYKTVEEALFGMCELFEDTFKEKYNTTEVLYEITDVIVYFQNFQEILMMIYDEELENYVPRDDEWILHKLSDFGTQAMSDEDALPTKSGMTNVNKEEEDNWDDPDVMI